MKSILMTFQLACTLLILCMLPARSQSQKRYVLTPNSSLEAPGDVGLRAHTNHLIYVDPASTGNSPTGETPASLACVYNTTSRTTPGCTIAKSKTNASGGSGVIAIVDAFDYPTAENDLNVFASQFGLPPCTTSNGCFQKVFAGGTQPTNTSGNASNVCGWGQEAALDIEWAHAMAPNARIVLVEAQDSSIEHILVQAVPAAASVIQANGGIGEISMSWGGKEFNGETKYDSVFLPPPGTSVVYVAASGDIGGVTSFPSTSPNVVAAGGTTIRRSSTGNFLSEIGWGEPSPFGSGGGLSQYEPRPAYQNNIQSIVGTQRGVPDFSFDADPFSGVSVYDSVLCQGYVGWQVFGGTSVASPSLAGIINLAGHFYMDGNTELNTIYGNLGDSSVFRDITSGSSGVFPAIPGWDFVTGVGSNQGLSGK